LLFQKVETMLQKAQDFRLWLVQTIWERHNATAQVASA